ncbi:hypothetical protein Goe27_02480 [Bacillus phage vB_BsuM-Goe27]|nr:hypothetical protein Goe27_02480 [Bacillus phage vB_BsuM-Goe27]
MVNKEVIKTLVLERVTLGAKLTTLHEALSEAEHNAGVHGEEVTREQLLDLIRDCARYIADTLNTLQLGTLHKDTHDYMDLLKRIEELYYMGGLEFKPRDLSLNPKSIPDTEA